MASLEIVKGEEAEEEKEAGMASLRQKENGLSPWRSQRNPWTGFWIL